MFCTNCGTEIEDDVKFCTCCGSPITRPIDEQETTIVDSVQAGDVAIADAPEPEEIVASTASESEEIVAPETPKPEEIATPETPINPQPNPFLQSRTAQPTPSPFTQPQSTPAAAPAPSPKATTPFVPANEKKMSTKKTILIVTAICAAILLAVGIGVFAFTQVKKNEAQHVTTEVQFAYSYSGDTANEPIGVPLLVEGTDLDGRHVEQKVLATSSGGSLDLLAGSYTISVEGMPVSKNGVVYEVQSGNICSLEIPVPPEDGGTPQPIIPDLNISFTPIAAELVDDQLVDVLKTWMSEYGVNSTEISTIAAAIIDRRNAEIARITLEQEKQAALAANPSVMTGDNRITNAPSYQLTGTVRVKYVNGVTTSGNVCYLELPNSVTVVGTQYGGDNDGPTSNNIILGNNYTSYDGKVVTISAQVGIRPTGSIAEAQISPIWAHSPTVIRTF